MDEINTQLQQNDSNERKENNVLIKCRACGKDMSYFAKSCPNCGHPNEALAEDVQKRQWNNTIQKYLFRFEYHSDCGNCCLFLPNRI